MSKEKKYAVIVVVIGIVVILLVYYLAMRNLSQPISGQPILSSNNKSEKAEKPDNSNDKIPTQSLAGVTDNKPEYPITSSQIASIPQSQSSPLPKETEQEKLLYAKSVSVLNPVKLGEDNDYIRYEINFGIVRNVINGKTIDSPRTTNYQESCEIAIKDLEELIRQYQSSTYIQHYQETIALLKQMLQEDKEFPYLFSPKGGAVFYKERGSHPEVSPDEKVKTYIHYLRKECLLDKVQGSFKMCFDQPSDDGIIYLPDTSTISFGRRIVQMGDVAVQELINLLDDRRPITVNGEIGNIPARFYRYQDAAIDILQTMFSPEGNKINPKLPSAQRPFPVEIPAGEYFSEYLEKQPLEAKQKIINDIKIWTEECLNNPVKPEQPPK